jgi:hypothetical protein
MVPHGPGPVGSPRGKWGPIRMVDGVGGADDAGMSRQHPQPPAVAPPSTPVDGRRDPVLDVARAGALGVVVLWHWVFTTVDLTASGPRVGNPIPEVAGLWALTWVAQVMPLFFLVGGAVHAMALERRGPAGFVARRLRRLVLPALPLVVPAALVWAAATAFGHVALARTVVLLVSPLWFAAVYAVLVVLAPAAWRAQRRWPVGTPVALAVAVVAVDVGRFVAGWSSTGYVLASFVVVWAAVHQLGFAWSALVRRPVAGRLGVALLGYAGLGLCVVGLGYPASLVGVPGEVQSNMGPPNLAVACLGVAQLGLLAVAAGPLARFAHRWRRLVDAASSWAMTVFVWHLAAWGLAYVAVTAVGVAVPADVGPAWWAQRPLWLLAPAAVAVPLCRATRRFDRTAGAGRR